MIPKFKKDDVVNHPPNLCKETESVVEKSDRNFKALLDSGKFDPDGLTIRESDIDSIQLPYKLEGDTLSIEYPETDHGSWVQKARTEVYKFHGYSYNIKSPKMCCIYPEKSLRLKKAS